jgi:hypothetical protein
MKVAGETWTQWAGHESANSEAQRAHGETPYHKLERHQSPWAAALEITGAPNSTGGKGDASYSGRSSLQALAEAMGQVGEAVVTGR